MPRLLKGLAYVPWVVITDTLASDGTALCTALASVEHRRHEVLNNRTENAHQPTHERERRMRRFEDPGHARRFFAAHGPIVGPCRPRRHRLTAAAYRETGIARFAPWRAGTGAPAMARAANTPRLTLPRAPPGHSPRVKSTLWIALYVGG